MILNNSVAGRWIEANWPKKFDRKVISDHPDVLNFKGTYIFDLCQNAKTGEIFVWNINTSLYEADSNFAGYFSNLSELQLLMPMTKDQFAIAMDEFEYNSIPFEIGKVLTATSDITDENNIIGNATLAYVEGVWNPVGSGDSGDITYTNSNPVPTKLGGISSGTTFDEVSIKDMFDMLLYPYQVPAFSSFNISGLSPTTVEVGTSFPEETRNFSWSFSNASNVRPNTTTIIDLSNGNTQLATNVNSSPQALLVPELVKNTATSHSFRVQATNTMGNNLNRTYTVNWQWALYYGESTNPVIDGSDAGSLRVKTLSSNKNGTYNFNAGGYKYFAWPTSFGSSATFKDTATNLDVAMESPFTVSITNSNGVSNNYFVFRTTNILGGRITVRVS